MKNNIHANRHFIKLIVGFRKRVGSKVDEMKEEKYLNRACRKLETTKAKYKFSAESVMMKKV